MKNSRAFITLNEAITWFAFAELRTPHEELALRVADQHKLVDLIDRAVHQAQTSPKYQAFPQRLPYSPRSALRDRLDACRSSWPPLAKNLYSLATRQLTKWHRYDKQYEVALSTILEAAADKRIELVGQVARTAGAEVCVIPWTDLLGQVTIDYQRAHLGPDITAVGRPSPFAILKCGTGRRGRNYYNVQVSRREFHAVFKSSLAPLSSQSRSEIEKAVENWYKQRVSKWPKGRTPPSRIDDMRDARSTFGEVRKFTPLVRSLRRAHAPHEWTKGGRRPADK